MVLEKEFEDEISTVFESPPPTLWKMKKTVYYCPLMEPANPFSECTFFIMKEEFNDGMTLTHPTNVHQIKSQNTSLGKIFKVQEI